MPRLDQGTGEKLIPIEGLPPDLGHLPPGCSFYPRCTFRIDKCKEEYPPLQLVAENHYAACWVDVTKGKAVRTMVTETAAEHDSSHAQPAPTTTC